MRSRWTLSDALLEIAVEHAGDGVAAGAAGFGVVDRYRHSSGADPRPELETSAGDRIVPAHADAVGDLEIVLAGRLVHQLLVRRKDSL